MQADDVQRLFDIVTNICVPHNVVWRRSVCLVRNRFLLTLIIFNSDQPLISLAHSCVTEFVALHIGDRRCITKCLVAIQVVL